MLGRKFFKTKLCKLYQGGRCPRQNCSFAHGNSELRHVPGVFNGCRYKLCFYPIEIMLRPDYRSSDLRDKLDRRISPPRRYSPGRDARGYHDFHRQKPVSRDRGHSRSRSPIKRSERRHRKKHHSDGESEDSGSFKITNGTGDKRKDGKISSQGEKDALGEQLKKIQLEIEMLDDHKSQLEAFLEEKNDEAHKFSSKIEDLEMQLNKEQEDYKRITSKIRRFVRAHGRYVKAQDELKRSQARLQRLGDHLGSDTSKVNEEDSSANFASDGEPNVDKQRSPRNYELQNNTSMKKRPHAYAGTSEEAQIGNISKRKKIVGITNRLEKVTRAEGPHHSESDNKESKSKRAVHSKKDVLKSLVDEYKHKHGKFSYPGLTSLDKVKGSEMGHSLPSTSMAAHAIDELIEAIDIEEKHSGKEATAANEIGAGDNKANLSYVPPPPPPPVVQNAYRQYEGDDEDVDVEKVDLETMDVNSEVEIE